MTCRREWCARGVGVGAALALAWWWQAQTLQVVGVLALARALAWASALWLAPALPARRLRGAALARRAVLVTGCDSGFGHAAARRLHALGARVFACVLLPHGAGADSLRALASPRMRVLPLDVTDADSVAAAARAVQQDLQDTGCELQAIVNNAGILNIGEINWLDIEELRQTIDVNAIGQMRVTQAFLPLLRKSKGRIVNMNSIAGRFPCNGLTPYVVSKYASTAFTECLQVDMMKFSVSVHSIEPAIYMTPMAEGSKSLIKRKIEAIPEETLNDSGRRYKDQFMKLADLLLVTAKPQSKIYEVIDAIEDACLSEDPQNFYYPGGPTKLILTLKDEITNLQGFVLNLVYKFW
ncbi:Dehydrogenase/reductase SDR family protein 7-like [Gryllus bimaculatus]|nr:Dehydrogenase/reductase SDR family protein 7-like [Gryllus bimaculatus]